jgi:hypothetical protein
MVKNIAGRSAIQRATFFYIKHDISLLAKNISRDLECGKKRLNFANNYHHRHFRSYEEKIDLISSTKQS